MQVAIRVFKTALLAAFLTLTSIQADQGLWPADENRIPEKVREKFSSVFRVVVLTQEANGKVPIIPEERYRALEQTFSDDGFMGDYLRKRGAHYREQGEKQIPVEINAIGTGFLMDRGDRLVTVMHYFKGGALESAFIRLLRSRSKEESRAILRELTEGKVHFLLFDLKGKLVFDTRNENDIALMNVMPDLRVPYSARNAFTPVALTTITNNDLLAFELNRKLGAPIVTRDRSPEVGDAVYAPGFPIKTTDRAPKYQAKDANGFDIVCSVGKVLDSAVLTEYTPTTRVPENAEEPVKVTRENLLLADFDGEEGMSGGPVLDQEGRLVSVQRMGFREVDFAGDLRKPIHDKYASVSVMLRTERLKASLRDLENNLVDVKKRLE